MKGKVLSDYADMIREVARYYSLPVIDLYDIYGVQPSISVQREMYMPDGLHPSDKGYEVIAHKLKGFLERL
jgi:lysophospholipase L1-like esterase